MKRNMRNMILKFEEIQKMEHNKYIITATTMYAPEKENLKFKLYYSDRGDVLTVHMYDKGLAERLAIAKISKFLPLPEIELKLDELYFDYKSNSSKPKQN